MKIRINKGQSIIEYICVFLVFAAAGIAVWALTNRSFTNYQNKSTDQILQSSSNATNP